MIRERHMTFTLVSLGSGLLLAAMYAASPLTVWVLLAVAVLFRLAGRGLPHEERRPLFGILAAAFIARIAFVGALFLAGLPHHNDLSIGALAGDEAYYLSRALRSRDILLGFSDGNYDYFVTTDEYGRTSYLGLLTWLQVVFGPTPYSMRLLNALFFLSGATLLYRTVRTAFGSAPALCGLMMLLFLPSLFISSVSLLKESLYFFAASALFACVVRLVRSRTARHALLFAALTAGCMWLLNDLRRGAVILAMAGFGVGLAVRMAAGTRRRFALAVLVVVAGGLLALARPGIRARVLDGVESAAKTHAGHVFTVGHAYKLMDEGFYWTPETPSTWDLTLTEPQAARFAVRALISFVVTPLPWEMRSRNELAFLPEHLLWYVMLALLPVGFAAGWKRDRLVTSLLIGYVLPTAAVLALTNGNVGTLLRLRGLVTPYVIWLSALGLLWIADALTARRAWPQAAAAPALSPERPMA